MKKHAKNGRQRSMDEQAQSIPSARRGEQAGSRPGSGAEAAAAQRRSTIAKVSHTLSLDLARRLEEFAFFQRISESAVIEYSLNAFFALSKVDAELGDMLRREGAGRRRKS
jgi:hypothetical protein